MDTLTHMVLGACLGEVIAGKQLGKKAMLWGALANNIPDVDVVSSLWLNQVDSMLAHRGITHSIVFAVIFSPVLAITFKNFFAKEEITFLRCVLLFGSGLFLHIFIDAFTVYGTGWFEPFSHNRISFNTLFIIDPLFSLPMIIAVIIGITMGMDSTKRNKCLKAGLIISSIYFVATICNKYFVDRTIDKNLNSQHITYTNYMSTPTALNNFLWYIIVNSGTKFYIGYYSVFDKKPLIDFEIVNKNDSLFHELKDAKNTSELIKFSKGYYCLAKKNDSILFNDMRFDRDGGWFRKQASFELSFNLQNIDNNTMTLQRGRFKAFNPESITKLFERIRGN